MATNKDFQQLRGDVKEILRIVKSIDVRVTALEKRMDSLEKRMDSLEKRMDALEKRMDSLEKRMDALEKRMDLLEERMDSLEKRVSALEKRVDSVDRRLGVIERNYVTRKLLDKRLSFYFNMTVKTWDFNAMFETERLQLSDLVLTSQSLIMGELKAMREEHAASYYRQVEHSKQLENHEERLALMESVH